MVVEAVGSADDVGVVVVCATVGVAVSAELGAAIGDAAGVALGSADGCLFCDALVVI